MRLWSLHPSVLDRAGLVALWREGLLAQKVLLGKTVGYRHHPQLKRFRETDDPVGAISTYLWAVVDEARARGYNFDDSKIATTRQTISLTVTRGQLQFECKHLCKKLRLRDPARLRKQRKTMRLAHPMLRLVDGDVEHWEVV